jgi:hypothetical protein
LTRECPECGEEVEQGDDFCGNCGEELQNTDDVEEVNSNMSIKEILLFTGIIGLAVFVFAGYGLISGNGEIPDNNKPSEASNEDFYSNFYETGSSKSQGNYLDLKSPKLLVKENNDTFDVQRLSVDVENTLSSDSEIATLTLELRRGELPSFRSRKTSWSERGEAKSSFDTKIYENTLDIDEGQRISLDPDEDLRNLQKGCYNATIVLRELRGLPSQGMYSDPNNFYVAGIKSGEICVKQENTGFVYEIDEIVSRALGSNDVPEGFSGYGKVSENSSVAKRTYIAFYSYSDVSTGDVEFDRSFNGVNASISELISNNFNSTKAKKIVDNAVEDSYTRVDSAESNGKAWIGGEVNLSDNQMTGGDTNVNMTLVMQEGKYVALVDIMMTDYYTQDTQEVMEAALENMKISYTEKQLEESLENYWPLELSK